MQMLRRPIVVFLEVGSVFVYNMGDESQSKLWAEKVCRDRKG